MAVHETVTNAVASLFGSKTGLIAGLVAVAVLWCGAEYVSGALDVHLPLRQLLAGRSLNVFSLHLRFMYAVAVSYLAARFVPDAPRCASA